MLVVALLLSGCASTNGPGESGESSSTTKYWGSPMEDRITVVNYGTSEFAVSMLITNSSNGDAVVYNQTRTLEVSERWRPTDVFVGYNDYRVVLRVNGTQVFERNAFSYQRYQIEIESETEVDVTETVK